MNVGQCAPPAGGAADISSLVSLFSSTFNKALAERVGDHCRRSVNPLKKQRRAENAPFWARSESNLFLYSR